MRFDQQYIGSMINIILPALWETLYMVLLSSIFATAIGLIAGVTLYVTDKGGIMESDGVHRVLGTIVNIGRSIPFVIIIIAVFPLARFIVGTAIGSTAAIVALTIAAAPFVARVLESSLKELDYGVIEASISAGASNRQIITMVMLPEAASGIVLGITLTIVNLIGYSAMAGVVGGGGLGDVAIRYGYTRFRTDVLVVTVVIMVIMVQIIQWIGNTIADRLNKNKT